MLLGDYGTEVVKSRAAPGGDPARALAGFAVWNRNKQSVVADSYASTGDGGSPRYWRAPTCASTPTRRPVDGLPTPIRSSAPAHAAVHRGWDALGRWGGVARAAGGDRGAVKPPVVVRRRAGAPGVPVAPVRAGVWAAACAVAALVERQRSGLGQTVTVAGIHGALACSPSTFALDPALPPTPTNVGAGGRHPTYRTFRCKDGEWLFMAALTPSSRPTRSRFSASVTCSPTRGSAACRPGSFCPENRGWVRSGWPACS